MKTPTELLNQVTCNGMRELTNERAIEAIEAYHSQFTTTASERENQLLKAFAKYVFMDEDADDHLFIEDFLQSDLFKSIPPAMPMQTKCTNCNGLGYYAGHADLPHPDGDCCGNCPVQIECEVCKGTGYIETTAMPMPSREEANFVSDELYIDTDLSAYDYAHFKDGFMSCYDWLVERAKQ